VIYVYVYSPFKATLHARHTETDMSDGDNTVSDIINGHPTCMLTATPQQPDYNS